MQKQAAFEKYENRVQELMHDEKQQERLEEAKAAKEKELERHTVRTRTTYGTYSYDTVRTRTKDLDRLFWRCKTCISLKIDVLLSCFRYDKILR